MELLDGVQQAAEQEAQAPWPQEGRVAEVRQNVEVLEVPSPVEQASALASELVVAERAQVP
jgi:hypothetical protein